MAGYSRCRGQKANLADSSLMPVQGVKGARLLRLSGKKEPMSCWWREGGDTARAKRKAERSKAYGPVHIPVLVYIPNTQVFAMPVSFVNLTLLGTIHGRQHRQYADCVRLCIGSCA